MKLFTPKTKLVTLSDGTKASCVNRPDAKIVDAHVRGYLHDGGIELPEKDAVIVDVGGNVGLFAVRLVQRFPTCRVLLFEPAPLCYKACQENAERHQEKPDQIKCYPFGLSSKQQKLNFHYFPHCSPISTVYPDEWNNQAVEQIVRSNLKACQKEVPLVKLFPKVLSPIVPYYLMSGRQVMPMEFRTLSSVVAEEGLTRIDLLKIDCEGSELDVLLGIQDDHWQMIQQVVAEVNDVDGRIAKVKDLFEKHGFDSIVEETEDGFAETHLRNVIARRTKTAPQ